MAFKGGSTNVDAAGTAQQLSATRMPFTSLTIQADPGNAADVFIGDSTVSSSSYFIRLGPGDSFPLSSAGADSVNPFFIWIDAETTNDDVNFAGIAR